MRGVAPLLILGAIAGLLLLGAAGFGGYQYVALRNQLASTSADRSTLADELAKSRTDNEQLSQALADQIARNTDFETQIGNIQDTVGTLTKLSHTDRELLQKYSKVYFLNENYIPQSLASITPEFTLEPSRTYYIHSKVKPYLENMIKDAADDNVHLLVVSAYRSFGDQAALKYSYTVTYGSGANRFSADQGYSEHQLGTAVDFATKEQGALSLSFGSTTAGVWLDKNAYRYGFILSYPKGNKYYQYEPWHWRYVGVNLATRLHQDNEHFYDLPQRDIDQYLADIFD